MIEILKYIVGGLGGLYLLFRIGSHVVFLLKNISNNNSNPVNGLSKKLGLERLKTVTDPFSLHEHRAL